MGGGISLPVIIILVVIFMMKGGSAPGTGSTGDSGSSGSYGYSSDSGSSPLGGALDALSGLTGGSGSSTGLSGGYQYEAPSPQSATYYTAVDNSVAAGARAKRTNIQGGGNDTVTLMVYMCGTDLESKYGMATNDLREMASARYGDNVRIIVYTGGCSQWKTPSISSSVNQIYRVRNGGLENLVRDDGAKAMTDPATLSSFIRYCAENFPATRYDLILWDHGGGSVSGYGYDEKYRRSGSMGLGELGKALDAGGVTFDFIGFDACLMATAETALLMDRYADYMIASEETEPGIGWYYTEWLSKLGDNTSMPTTEIGKNIIDDYTNACAQQCRGQKTTLSLIDLAEFSATVPSKLSAFSKSVSGLITENSYKTVSNARYTTREFAPSTGIDQIDLVHFASNLGTPEGKELCDALKGAVKYNRTSRDMTNAYGVSIYFPYKKVSNVDNAVSEYDAIGFDDDYATCIKQFAALETGGQAASGGSYSPVSSLLGQALGSSSGDLLNSFLSGGFDIVSGLGGNTSFLSDRAIPDETITDYVSLNSLDNSALVWTQENGKYKLRLSEEQWSLVHDLDLNIFYDTGEGYVDLGYDNTLTFDEEGCLVMEDDRTWLAVNDNIVAYYRTDTSVTEDDTIITGFIPAELNGERVRLMVVFDNAHPYGHITGAQTDYIEGETETSPKNLTELNDGDEIRFLCDFYSYSGERLDTYYLGQPTYYSEDMDIANMDIGSGNALVTYRFTDIYNSMFWTEAVVLESR